MTYKPLFRLFGESGRILFFFLNIHDRIRIVNRINGRVSSAFAFEMSSEIIP